MIVIGIGLGFIKVPEKKVTEAYSAKYPPVLLSDNKEILDKISLTKEENHILLTNNTGLDIVGVYFGDNYTKVDFKQNTSVEISAFETSSPGHLTSVVYLENE